MFLRKHIVSESMRLKVFKKICFRIFFSKSKKSTNEIGIMFHNADVNLFPDGPECSGGVERSLTTLYRPNGGTIEHFKLRYNIQCYKTIKHFKFDTTLLRKSIDI